jgi:hypothetical protein
VWLYFVFIVVAVVFMTDDRFSLDVMARPDDRLVLDILVWPDNRLVLTIVPRPDHWPVLLDLSWLNDRPALFDLPRLDDRPSLVVGGSILVPVSVVLAPPVLIPGVVGFSALGVALGVIVTLLSGDPDLCAPPIVVGNPIVGVIDHIAVVVDGLPAIFHHRAAHHYLPALSRDQTTILKQSGD